MGDNQYVIDISTNADSSSVEELASKLQDVEQSAQRVTDTLSNTDSSGLDSASDSASNAADSLERADEAANNFSNDVNNVDGGALEDTANSAENASTEIDNASDSANALSAAASGIASAGIAATMMSWADSGGNAQSQWTRMAIAMKDTGMTAAQVQSTYGKAVSALSSSTGRGAGDIREFFIQMGLSGVTNIDTIKSSFSALAGSAFVTGNNLQGLEEFFQRLTKSGKLQSRQLATQFKMSMSDIGAAMNQLGISTDGTEADIKDKFQKMSESQRAQVLSTALAIKDGESANEDYKESWDGVKQQMSKAEGGFKTFVGQLLLPTLIPALNMASWAVNAVTGAFKSAPAPVQGVIGTVASLAGGFIVLVLAISTVRSVLGLLNIMQTLSAIKSGALTLATYAQTAATYASAAAQWALNAAMSANPIAIIIIAIIALVAILVYLWTTNEGFRNAVIGMWAAISGAFTNAGHQIYGAIVGIISTIRSYFANLPSQMYIWGVNAINGFINAIIKSIPGLRDALNLVSYLFPHSPPKEGPLSTITAANMFAWASSIAYAGTSGFSSLSLSGISSPNLSIGYGSASLGFDATELNASLAENRELQSTIINYNNDVTVNQDGIMSQDEAAEFTVNAINAQLEKENLINGKSG